MVKIVTRICNTITILFTVVVIGIVGILIVPRFFGYDTYAVLSGSMEPFYHIGSIVYVDKDINPEVIEVGDPITFKRADGAVATHRVIEVDKENQEFRTKGDANNVEDSSPVSYAQVIGRAGHSIPYLGNVSIQIKSKKGILMAVGVLLLLIIINLIPEIIKPEESKEEKETKLIDREKKNE